MKLVMNGALTLGTRDGATIEMARRWATRISSCSGSTPDEVARLHAPATAPRHYSQRQRRIEVGRSRYDRLRSFHAGQEDRIFRTACVDALITHGDYYLHLADYALVRQPRRSESTELYRAPAPIGPEVHSQCRELWGNSPATALSRNTPLNLARAALSCGIERRARQNVRAAGVASVGGSPSTQTQRPLCAK